MFLHTVVETKIHEAYDDPWNMVLSDEVITRSSVRALTVHDSSSRNEVLFNRDESQNTRELA